MQMVVHLCLKALEVFKIFNKSAEWLALLFNVTFYQGVINEAVLIMYRLYAVDSIFLTSFISI